MNKKEVARLKGNAELFGVCLALEYTVRFWGDNISDISIVLKEAKKSKKKAEKLFEKAKQAFLEINNQEFKSK